MIWSESESLDLLIQSLQNIQIDADRQDEVEWELEKSKIFTTKILYKFLMHGGAQVKDAENIWKTSLPTKIKVFLWRLSHDKFLFQKNLTTNYNPQWL